VEEEEEEPDGVDEVLFGLEDVSLAEADVGVSKRFV
jgi:hypothetical protein